MSRMTPKRLAEIEGESVEFELVDALKAERERVEELEAEQAGWLQDMAAFYASLKKYGYETSNDLIDRNIELQSRIAAGLKLADEMEGRNYSGTMDWYAEQLREALEVKDD